MRADENVRGTRLEGNTSFDPEHGIPNMYAEADAVLATPFAKRCDQSDYVFPGSISGIWTHLTNIKSAQ